MPDPYPSRRHTTGPSTQSTDLSLTSAGTYIEAHMPDYDPSPTSEEELEQAYQEKYA